MVKKLVLIYGRASSLTIFVFKKFLAIFIHLFFHRNIKIIYPACKHFLGVLIGTLKKPLYYLWRIHSISLFSHPGSFCVMSFNKIL